MLKLIVGRKGEEKEAMLIGVNMRPAYSYERKLLLEMIDGMNVKAKYIMADVLYGMSTDVLKEFFDRADIVLVPVRDTLHTKMKDPIRKRARKVYKSNREKYRQRYIVEQVIGKIKNAYGSSERTRSYDMAVKMVWVKMIMFNWAIVISFLMEPLISRFLIINFRFFERTQSLICNHIGTPPVWRNSLAAEIFKRKAISFRPSITAICLPNETDSSHLPSSRTYSDKCFSLLSSQAISLSSAPA
jgi:hypothetical protein